MELIITKKDNQILEREELKQAFTNLSDWTYLVNIKKWSKRSLEQNKYYWTLLTIVQDDTGIDKDELHEIFKNMFLKQTHVSDTFGEIEVIGSTTKLTVWSFIDYVEKLVWRCREQWYEIPLN